MHTPSRYAETRVGRMYPRRAGIEVQLPVDREAAILRLLHLTKRDLAERLQDTQRELADACERVGRLAEENHQLREQLGIERGRER